jgi:hypothetical protein
MEDEQEEDEIMNDNTLMRLGIHEEWYETFGDLNQMCRKSVKSWDSDVEEINEVLKREGRSAVMEVYSPPRVDALARMWNLMPGMSLDLTTVDPDDGKPWDFNVAEKRDKAEAMIEKGSAMLLVGSPMCSAFSQLQTFNWRKMGSEKVSRLIRDGSRHLRFCAKLYRMQLEQGLYFLHEHSAHAKSWKDPTICKLMEDYRVNTVVGSMCMFGMSQGDPMLKEEDHQSERRPLPTRPCSRARFSGF